MIKSEEASRCKRSAYACLKGELRRDSKHLYQCIVIDECMRFRFMYGFEEHSPENTVKFLKILVKVFPFHIKAIQNGKFDHIYFPRRNDYRFIFKKGLTFYYCRVIIYRL